MKTSTFLGNEKYWVREIQLEDTRAHFLHLAQGCITLMAAADNENFATLSFSDVRIFSVYTFENSSLK